MGERNTRIRASQISEIAPTDITANATNAVVDGYIPSKAAGVDQWTWVENAGGSSLPVVDTTGIAKGSVDATKIVRLEVDGLTTATTRVLTVQDKDGTIALTSNKLSDFAATTSAELLGIISDETGSGLLVFATSPTFATSITASYLTASEMLISDADKKIVSAPVATYPSLTELSYVKGLSSAVQTQINGKAATDSDADFASVSLGGANAAATGAVRLLNNTVIAARNAANTADKTIALLDTKDCTRIGISAGESIVDNGTMVLEDFQTGLVVMVSNFDGCAVFVLSNLVVYELSDPDNLFSATADTATSTNLYYTGGNLTIQNKSGGLRSYYITHIK